MKKVAVLMGGRSNERAVSLASGQNVAEALASLGKYDVLPLDLTEENLAALPADIEAAYIALHGGWGENGGVQAALNARKIPYTGPGVEASQIAMDKIRSKTVLEAKGIPTAPWAFAQPDTATSPLPLPVVVKPPCDGSSVGISKVVDAAEWAAARDAAFAAQAATPDAPILVEKFIAGREFTVGVLDGTALPVIEIVAKNGWYGYEEKYNSNETRYPFYGDDPATIIPGCPPAKLQELAVAAFRAVGCRGITRVDFRVTPEGDAFVLELNTSPGFTSHSLVPKAGMKTGLTFAGVCERILQSADYDR